MSASTAVVMIASLATSGPAGAGGQSLDQSLRAVHEAGMYGVYSSARDGGRTWRGAAGVADLRTRRPVRPDLVHRIGSVTKAFTAVAVLRQVDRGAIGLDTPVRAYLPELVTDERITVRMLLNHTSHIPDYLPQVFPSTVTGSPESLDANRFRAFTKRELAELGLGQPPTGEPGAEPGAYSNTNYILAGLVLERVTGRSAEEHITGDVIRRAGLRHTSFPRTPRIPGPHSKAYTSIFGLVEPPREYSVYDMSWASTAGAITSTMDDLNRFFRALLGGELLGAARLADMRTTVPITAGQGRVAYGLGIYAYDLPCGRFWGTDGGVFGMGTRAVAGPDGRRQLAFGTNRTWYQRLNDDGGIDPHPIDHALDRLTVVALCGTGIDEHPVRG
ncbi:serine hydrolase domain-containing protein [Nonomuraea candida]|uniref:serine hydrolase domain-containing protein n=1 Tax=Nonomuraea candida TaxID=359159 RepID=UPI001FE1334D|nr:serine hydrolase domain-containing protein [Nonomuraea candida]